MSETHDSRAVANYILDLADDSGRSLTIMQLVKLVYIANGWALALFEAPLIDEPVEAWQYGPVVPNVYRAFAGAGSRPISFRATEPFSSIEYRSKFSKDEKSLIRSVFDKYGSMHAYRLSDLTHRPNTPWSITYKKNGAYSQIPQSVITAHFKKLSS